MPKKKKRMLKRRRRTPAERQVLQAYAQVHREINLYGRRSAATLLRQLVPKLTTKDAQAIVRKIAVGEPVLPMVVTLVLHVRRWWGTKNDVVRTVHRKLRTLNYDLICK